MYTIKRAAELTGISLATLRAWERRYGVVAPARSDGRYRLYSDADVRALSIMASLVGSGWTASEAAAETKARVAGTSHVRKPHVVGRGAVGDDGAPAQPLEPPGHLDDLLRGAARLDVHAVDEILDRQLSAADFDTTVESWLLPVLVGVGDAWADGRLSVAGEHLVSNAVHRRVAARYEGLEHVATGPAVLLGLPPGARHDLGILAFATLARRAGLRTVYLGADLPVADWVKAAVERRAAAVVLAVPRPADVPPATQVVDALSALPERPVVCLGGSYQADVVAPNRHTVVALGHGLADGVRLLRDALPRAEPGGP